MKIRYINYRKDFPSMGKGAFSRWFTFSRHWGGKIIEIGIRHHAINLDLRKDFISDMTNGKVKLPRS